MKVGDKVYVVNWGGRYSSIYKWVDGVKTSQFGWKTEIPAYSDIQFHDEFVYEDNLTLKGTINKREPRKLVETIPVWKNFKYEIVEIIDHPTNGNKICLIQANGCWVQIGIDSLSLLTPKQYADKEFNAMIEANLGKWTPEALIRKVIDKLPKEIVSIMFDIDDRVLFGSHYTRGKVEYRYLEAKFMKDNVPYYLGVSILYDGEGNSTIPENSEMCKWKDLKERFPNN